MCVSINNGCPRAFNGKRVNIRNNPGIKTQMYKIVNIFYNTSF